VRLIEEWLKKPQIGNLPSLLPTEKSIPQVAFRYQAMRLCVRHPYLEDIRCIPPALTSHWRFNGRLRLDGTGNEVFPHMAKNVWSAAGLQGLSEARESLRKCIRL
jgi:hypothetical protein